MARTKLDVEPYSAHNEVKSVVAERYVRILKSRFTSI